MCVCMEIVNSPLSMGRVRFFLESHNSIKSVVPNIGVGTLPRGHKISLRGGRMMNGAAKKKKTKFGYRNLYFFGYVL